MRTRLLLHLIDVSRTDPVRDPIADFAAIAAELEKHDRGLLARERWLLFNKMDLTESYDDGDFRRDLHAMSWDGPVYRISAATGEGCDGVMRAVYEWLQKKGGERDDGDG